MNLHNVLFEAVMSGINLERNRTWLTVIPRGWSNNKPLYQVWSERRGRFYTECFKELDPAIYEFIERST